MESLTIKREQIMYILFIDKTFYLTTYLKELIIRFIKNIFCRFWKFDSGEAVIRVLPPIETDSYDRNK